MIRGFSSVRIAAVGVPARESLEAAPVVGVGPVLHGGDEKRGEKRKRGEGSIHVTSRC